MNQKPKALSFVLNMIASAIKGVIASIVLVLLLALLLKFVDLKDNLITIFDEIIKIISLFICVKSIASSSPNKIILKAFLTGVLYTFFTFVLFSALKGSYVFGVGPILDILLGGVIGAIWAVLINIFSKEKIRV